MSINLSLLILAGIGSFSAGYGCIMAATEDDGSLMLKVGMIAGGLIVVAASVFMKFIFSLI